MAATTSLLANPDQPAESRTELIKIADEEAKHLRELIDDARGDGTPGHGEHPSPHRTVERGEIVREVVDSMRIRSIGRPVNVICDEHPPKSRSINGWSNWRSSNSWITP